MDGKRLIEVFTSIASPLLPQRIAMSRQNIFEYLDSAACEFYRTTLTYTKTYSFTTVALQQEYFLPTDFIEITSWDADTRKPVVLLNDGTEDYYPYYDPDYDEDPVSIALPDTFTISESDSTLFTVTGTTTSAGAYSYGGSVLTNSSGLFTTTNLVFARDSIRNLTNNSQGVIISVDSATALSTALFGGKTNAWGSGDSYRISRQKAIKLIFNDIPSTAGYTVTVSYAALPPPVYTDITSWFIPDRIARAICAEAAVNFLNERGIVAPQVHHQSYLHAIDQAERVTQPNKQRVRGKRSFI